MNFSGNFLTSKNSLDQCGGHIVSILFDLIHFRLLLEKSDFSLFQIFQEKNGYLNELFWYFFDFKKNLQINPEGTPFRKFEI